MGEKLEINSIMQSRKRLKRSNGICSCTSPITCSSFCWYELDLWTYIARFLDGKSLAMLAATNKWFRSVIMQESVWKYACLRDLQVPCPRNVSFSWIKLYAASFDGSHSYMFRQQDKHIDWIRIGAFAFDSQEAFLSERLSVPLRLPKGETMEDMLQSSGACTLTNIKSGIWIADLQLVRCPVCDQDKCDGTMQTLDARHIELFLSEGYQDGSWEYEQIGFHEIKKQTEGASGAIVDIEYLGNNSTARVFNAKTWIGKPDDYQPKAIIALHAVAVNTNLQENEGLMVKYHAMRAGTEGEIVSIRVSQQLL